MESNTKQNFFEIYNPIRNIFDVSSLIDNTMFDSGDDDQMEYVDDNDEKKIWSYTDQGELKNGRLHGPSVIGYVITKQPWNGKIGEIKYIV